jgi:hypothetical protein
MVFWLIRFSIVAWDSNLQRLYPLARRGILACGTVSSIDPKNHQAAHYSYEVDGKTYLGIQQGGVGNQGNGSPCNYTLTRYIVYYLPENPRISCLGNPNSQLENEEISFFLAILIFPPVVLLIYRARYTRFRKWLEK